MPGSVLDIETRWHPSLLALSCGIALLGTFTTVLLLDERRRSKHRQRQRFLMIGVAVALGGVAAWCARLVASSALLLRQGSMELRPYHDLRGVAGSLVLTVMSVLCGLAIAAQDKYFGTTKQQRIMMLSRDLKLTIRSQGGAGMDRTAGMKLVEMKALTADLWVIATGGVFSALGVIAADYVGLSTTYYLGSEGAHAVYRPGGITATIVIGFVFIQLAYWIIFRVLQWRQREEGLRLASALLISVPLCSMHYLALTSVDYHRGPMTIPASYFLVDSHGVWQLACVMCCVAYCTLGLYITTYNVRTEMSALKDEIDILSRTFAAMNAHNSGTSTNAYQNKLDAFLYKCAAFLQRYTRNSQDLAFDGVAQRLKVIRKRVPSLHSPQQLAGRLSRVLTTQWNNRVVVGSENPSSPQSSYGQGKDKRGSRDASGLTRGSNPGYSSPVHSPANTYEMAKDPGSPQAFIEDAGVVMAVISEGTESGRSPSKNSLDVDLADEPIPVPLEAPPGVEIDGVRDPYADAFEMAAPQDDFMYTGALARKPSADLPPVHYKAPMPEQMYGSYASWGEGMRGHSQGPNHAKGRSSGGESCSLSVSVSERRRSSSSISMLSIPGTSDPPAGPLTPDAGVADSAGDDREGSPSKSHFPFAPPAAHGAGLQLTVIPECDEASRTYNTYALDSTKTAADVLLETNGRASTATLNDTASTALGEERVEGETVVRLQRLSDGTLRLVALNAVTGQEMSEVVRVENEVDAQATASMLADAMLSAMHTTVTAQSPSRLTLRRMSSNGAGPPDSQGQLNGPPPSDYPAHVGDAGAEALGRQSDVDVRSVIESHLDQWEERQIFSAMLSGLLPSRNVHTPPPSSPRPMDSKGLTDRLLKRPEIEELVGDPRAHTGSGSGGLRRSMSSTVESSGRGRVKPAPRKQESMGSIGALLRQWSLGGQKNRSRGASRDRLSSQGGNDSLHGRHLSASPTGSTAMSGLRGFSGQQGPTSEAHPEVDAQDANV